MSIINHLSNLISDQKFNKHTYLFGFILIFLITFNQPIFSQGVGINTINPQQALHIGGANGTMRIESMNHLNNPFNGGDVDGDTDMTNNTYPLYVDENGEFTLEFVPLYNSDGTDAVDDAALPINYVDLPATDSDGLEDVQITLFTVDVTRATVLEVKYNLSFEVYLDTGYNTITDNLARRISTYFTVTGDSRKYGPVSKCYSSGSNLSVNGTMYNTSTAYINLPAAGSYDIQFYGEVSSNTKGAGGGTNSKQTYVEFATGEDSIFLTLH